MASPEKVTFADLPQDLRGQCFSYVSQKICLSFELASEWMESNLSCFLSREYYKKTCRVRGRVEQEVDLRIDKYLGVKYLRVHDQVKHLKRQSLSRNSIGS